MNCMNSSIGEAFQPFLPEKPRQMAFYDVCVPSATLSALIDPLSEFPMALFEFPA